MKNLKFVAIALFALVTVSSVNAQDSNSPWAVSFGVNALDYRGGTALGDIAKDYLGTSDCDVLSSVSRISVEKYLKDGFTLQVAGSLNELESDFYYAIDANVKYDVNKLVDFAFGSTTQWFDPYVYLGGGYTSIDKTGEAMLNVGVGFNTWFTETVGLNFQSGAKRQFTDKVKDHFQHSLGLVVKFGGKDTDGDGIYDKFDSCPDVAGLAAFNGCPDVDGDGIQDSEDACPNVAGLAALNGCPDADEDGIADKNDMCPNAKGSKANNGCPDADGDSIVDKDDNCPNVAGPAANRGCPWPDTDGDGVLDKDDNCVSVAGPASNNGCPEPVISEEASKSIGDFASSILFNTGRSSFKSGMTKQLDAIAALMNEFSKANFVIEGYADSTGGDKINAKISAKRANVVMKYLVSKGVDASRLAAKGYGASNPADSNKTRAGRAKNRRVEIKVSNN